jgi:hypothetical protein
MNFTTRIELPTAFDVWRNEYHPTWGEIWVTPGEEGQQGGVAITGSFESLKKLATGILTTVGIIEHEMAAAAKANRPAIGPRAVPEL